MKRIRIIETANGVSHTLNGVTVVYPIGRSPWLIWRGQVVTIERPERFGAWGTASERRDYTRKFAGA